MTHEHDEQPKRDDDDSDEQSSDRDAILARRRVFISSAIAGLVLGACDRLPNPFACLSPAVIENADASVSTPPTPCLEITPTPCLVPPRPIEQDAGALTMPESDASPGDSAVDANTATAQPRPCLSRATPRPCLSRPIPRACLRFAGPAVCLDFKSKDGVVLSDDDGSDGRDDE